MVTVTELNRAPDGRFEALEATGSFTDPSGIEYTGAINPVQVTEEASTFTESGITLTQTNTTVSDGSVELSGTQTSGNVVVKWDSGVPDDLESYDLATFQRTLNNETVTIDVISGTNLFDYTNNFYDVSDQTNAPTGLTIKDSKIYLCGDGFIYEFNKSDGSFDTSYDITSEDTATKGIVWDGSNFWVIGTDNDSAFKYDSTFTYQNTSIDVSTEDANPRGLTYDGSNYYLIGYGSNSIYEYDNSFSYTGTSYDVSGELGTALGVAWHDSRSVFYALGNAGTVFEYNSSGSYTGTSYDISSFAGNEQALTVGPNNIYISDTDDDNIEIVGEGVNTEFSDISQNFDISTVDTSKEVKLRANLSRSDTSNNPTVDYLARRFNRS